MLVAMYIFLVMHVATCVTALVIIKCSESLKHVTVASYIL